VEHHLTEMAEDGSVVLSIPKLTASQTVWYAVMNRYFGWPVPLEGQYVTSSWLTY
jgi:hypothetical protein